MEATLTDPLLSVIGVSAAVYASTNIDDLLILGVFFANPRVHVGSVVAGRFIGLAALVLVSGTAALLALAIPGEWIALLGLVPLALGLRLLPALFRPGNDQGSDEGSCATGGDTGVPGYGFAAQALSVAGVTLANGGDNLGVYIPLFAASPSAIATYVAVFAVMTLIWCLLGYLVVNNPLIGLRIRRYGHILLPVVLITLGLYILAGAARLFQ